MFKAILTRVWWFILRCIDAICCTDFAGTSPWGRNGFIAHCERVEKEPIFRQQSEEERFEMVLEAADHAWDLPARYFREMLDQLEAGEYPSKYPSVHAPVGRVQNFRYQSCPHNIMSGCHPSYSEEFRARLWVNPRWRQGLAHVFSAVPVEEAFEVASRMQDGYNKPVSDTILRAIEEGLFGHKPELPEWKLGEKPTPGVIYPTALEQCESQTPVLVEDEDDGYW